MLHEPLLLLCAISTSTLWAKTPPNQLDLFALLVIKVKYSFKIRSLEGEAAEYAVKDLRCQVLIVADYNRLTAVSQWSEHQETSHLLLLSQPFLG